MTYKKMTVDDFKARLKNGDYKDATGARRGAGKADLTDAEKDQCRRAIDKHFGTETASAAPAAKKTPVKKVKAAVSKKAAGKKAAASNGKAEKPNGVVTHAKRGRPRSAHVQASSTGESPRLQINQEDNALLVGLHLAKERIGTITQAVDTMNRAKEAYPALDTSPGMKVAAAALTDIMGAVHRSMNGQVPDLDPAVMATLAQTAPASMGLPGHQSPVQLPQQQQPAQVPPAEASIS